MPCFSQEGVRFQLARGLGVVMAQQVDEVCGQKYLEYFWQRGPNPPGCQGPATGQRGTQDWKESQGD